MALAYAGFMINLFNLIPLSPLDGGRITQILSPRIWFLGVPLLIALFFYFPSPLLILIAILAAPSLIAAWRYDPNSPEARPIAMCPSRSGSNTPSCIWASPSCSRSWRIMCMRG